MSDNEDDIFDLAAELDGPPIPGLGEKPPEPDDDQDDDDGESTQVVK